MGSRAAVEAFWNNEYKGASDKDNVTTHLALSMNPSEDLMKFTRWMEREYGKIYLNPTSSVLDLGCGNGRNLIWLAETYGMHGTGYDISKEATLQAARMSKAKELGLKYEARSIALDDDEHFSLPDGATTLALDMMTSHFLNEEERAKLREEIVRVLKPGGWLFLKTFLRDEDYNAETLLRDHPADEKGSYIHPKIGVSEHVFTEQELIDDLSPHFKIHKIFKSHRHLLKGKANKRRSISIYAEKI